MLKIIVFSIYYRHIQVCCRSTKIYIIEEGLSFFGQLWRSKRKLRRGLGRISHSSSTLLQYFKEVIYFTSSPHRTVTDCRHFARNKRKRVRLVNGSFVSHKTSAQLSVDSSVILIDLHLEYYNFVFPKTPI